MESSFCLELAALLKKYDANISFNVSNCSDIYGLSEERLVISYIENDIKKDVEIYGWVFDYSDL